ncbi:MAG: hypothetical protein KDI55_00130 [Anaerolineae bacterium]|nr:hypothetical protein [Anaerolineae bacterium]
MLISLSGQEKEAIRKANRILVAMLIAYHADMETPRYRTPCRKFNKRKATTKPFVVYKERRMAPPSKPLLHDRNFSKDIRYCKVRLDTVPVLSPEVDHILTAYTQKVGLAMIQLFDGTQPAHRAEAMAELRNAGFPYSRIGEVFNVNHTTVLYALDINGIRGRRHREYRAKRMMLEGDKNDHQEQQSR